MNIVPKEFNSITDDEINYIVKQIYGDCKITNIKRHKGDNSIDVNFKSNWCDGEKDIEIEDEMTLRPDYFDEPDFSQEGYEQHMYKQYMIAKGYSSIWINNPFINK